MLLNCNPRCKKSDGMTEASLDVERNEVVCKTCGDDIKNISDYTKQWMKRNKDIIIPAKKAFMFDCKNCHKKVEIEIINGSPYGKGCQTKACVISVSDIMVSAIEKMTPALEKLEATDDNTGTGIK